MVLRRKVLGIRSIPPDVSVAGIGLMSRIQPADCPVISGESVAVGLGALDGRSVFSVSVSRIHTVGGVFVRFEVAVNLALARQGHQYLALARGRLSM